MARFDIFCFYIYLFVMQYSTCCLTYADHFLIVRMYVYKQQTSQTRHSFTTRFGINGTRHLLREEIRAIIKESKTKP